MAVAVSRLSDRLADYRRWQEGLVETISSYQQWVEKQGLTTGLEDLRVYELIEALRSDKLTIALLAEFSRGKTELINAIFFADTGLRLLPSEAGRTTMCPTELLYDEKLDPCIRMLPIETRKSALSLAEYRRMPMHWTTLPLRRDDPAQMAETFREIVKTKRVLAKDAQELGLYSPDDTSAGAIRPDAEGRIEVPLWRHAVINYPHPLLKQGLVVLDTPGLNALGTEPELTLNMLPKAQAVLFLLAADTGVTKSDLEVWQRYASTAAGRRPEGRIAVLNKIDSLWDELRSPEAIHAAIERQAMETAQQLGVQRDQVFPVSAQKGLLAKIKGDAPLLARSGIQALETRLAERVIPAKQQLVRERVTRDLGAMIASTETEIATRLDNTRMQLAELRSLGGKNLDAIKAMMAKLREEKAGYDKTLVSFNQTRSVLDDQIRQMLEHMNMTNFDALIEETRKAMKSSWTTIGLKSGMTEFFQGANEAMERVNKQSHQVKSLVDAIYHKFHNDHGFPKMRPDALSLLEYRSELQKLLEEAEAFRASPMLVATEEHFVIKKFFISFVSRARQIFTECNQAAGGWSKAIMAPITVRIREHKSLLENRLENLKRVQANLDNMGAHIADLERERAGLEQQQLTATQLRARLTEPLPA
jgi:hypothetical protein